MNDVLNQNVQATLVPPKIPVVEQAGKGGLGVAELRKNPPEPVIVTAPLLSSVATGSTLVLLWDGISIDSYVLTEEQKATGLITFDVSPGQILDADRSELIYQVYTPIGGNPAVSNPYYVRVNTKAPGNPPLEPTEPINRQLVPPGNIPTPITDAIAENGVNVIIQPWLPATHMEVGDVLMLTWGQTKITLPPLTGTDLNKPVTVFVSKDVILATPNILGLEIFYDIRDIVGNWSLLSPATKVDVEAGPNTLPAPRVQEAVGDDDIDLAQLGASDAHVDIPTYLDWRAGDQVVTYWFGVTPEGIEINETDTYIMTRGDEGFTVTRPISNATVTAIANGRAFVYYEVNGIRRSKRCLITVSGEVQQLPEPQVKEQAGGVLDPDKVTGTGATVVVKAYAGMSTSDRVLLYWNGQTIGGDRTQFTDQRFGNDLGNDIIFNVPKSAHVDTLAGGSVDLYYTVVNAANITRDSAHLSLSVKASSPGFDLIKPRVPAAYGDGSRLNFDTAMYYEDYLRVLVNYTGLAPGQTVQLHWVGAVPYESEIKTVTAAGDLEFRVPRMEVIDVIGRSANITYTVTLANGSVVGTSAMLTLRVDAQPYDLVPPTINANNSIVSVHFQGMNTPQTGRVRWEGVLKHDTDDQNLDTRVEQFDIASSWVSENRGKEVLINYTIYRSNGTHLLFSRVLRKVM